MAPPVQACVGLSNCPVPHQQVASATVARHLTSVGVPSYLRSTPGKTVLADNAAQSAGQHVQRHVPQTVGILGVERVRGDSVFVIRSVGDADGFVAVLEIPTA